VTMAIDRLQQLAALGEQPAVKTCNDLIAVKVACDKNVNEVTVIQVFVIFTYRCWAAFSLDWLSQAAGRVLTSSIASMLKFCQLWLSRCRPLSRQKGTRLQGLRFVSIVEDLICMRVYDGEGSSGS